jgi:hypothetical protein
MAVAVLEPIRIHAVFGARSGLLDCSQRRIGIDMTGARAIAELTDAICGVRIFVFLMWSGFEITGMATRAIRLIGCK